MTACGTSVPVVKETEADKEVSGKVREQIKENKRKKIKYETEKESDSILERGGDRYESKRDIS